MCCALLARNLERVNEIMRALFWKELLRLLQELHSGGNEGLFPGSAGKQVPVSYTHLIEVRSVPSLAMIRSFKSIAP